MDNVAAGQGATPAATPPPAAPPPAAPPPPSGISVGSVGGAASSTDWRFDFHGYFRAPLRMGLGHRDNPGMGQSSSTVHNPLVPDDQYLSPQYTGAQSKDWSELFFSYGNSLVKGTVGLQGYNFTDAAWQQATAQFGIAQAWLTVTPKLGFQNVRLDGNVGAFWNKYGMAGKYDAGKYDTYLFGRTHQMGEAVKIAIDIGKVTLWAEEGFGGKQPDPNVYNASRFSLLGHAHGGLSWDRKVNFNFHFLYAWAQEEDRTANVPMGVTQPWTNLPDGNLMIFGPELAVRNTLIGELYLGFSRIQAKNAIVVNDVVEVIHSGGGGVFSQGITGNYLDGPKKSSTMSPSGGNGSINTLLLQYDFSLQNLLNGIKGGAFWGDGPDLAASFFMMFNQISSTDPDMDGVKKIKYGVDVLGTPLKWLGIGLRVDRVQPNDQVPEQSFGIVSPRIMFRTAFVTHEEISFQYSRYLYNARTCTLPDSLHCVQPPSAQVLPSGFGAPVASLDNNQRGAPITGNPMTDTFGRPDVNVLKLQATMWW
jgi:hypothetical protein